MKFLLPLLSIMAVAVSANYQAPLADQAYGAQASPVQVVQVPVPAPPLYNQPGYSNVAGGRRHGPFLDAFIDNHHHHHHGRHRRHHGSWSGSHEHHHHHHRHHHPHFPGYWPGFSPFHNEVISNPFFVPERRHHHHHHSHSSSDESKKHKHHHHKGSHDSGSWGSGGSSESWEWGDRKK